MRFLILGILFKLFMIIWLVQAVFLTRDGDYQAKIYDMLWAMLSLMLSMWYFQLYFKWRQS